jgi:hypothetical protein
MKQMDKKLKKAEKQYVKVFKENKEILKDRTTFEEFLKVVFTPEKAEKELILGDSYGIYELDRL